MHEVLNTPRVLIAEDDEGLRTMMMSVLKRYSVETSVATDGVEAISCLESHSFSVLSLDLMMPRVSGWQVIQWLGEHPDRRPESVIVVTAADRQSAERVDPHVVNAIFFKPFDVEQFAEYVVACAKLGARDRRRKRLFAL